MQYPFLLEIFQRIGSGRLHTPFSRGCSVPKNPSQAS